VNNEPGSKFAQGVGPVPRRGNGCHLTVWALAILGAFGALGAVVAGLVLLLGPGDGLGHPAGTTVLLAYLAFTFICIAGALVAWFIVTIKQEKPGTSRGLSERRQTGVEPDHPADTVPGGARGSVQEANASAHSDLVSDPSFAPAEPPKDGTATDQHRPKISPEDFREIGRRYSTKGPALQTQFHPDELTRCTGQRNDAPARHIQKESGKKRDSPLSNASAKNTRSTIAPAKKDKKGTDTSRCQHGKRRGYCAICDWDAYKDMQGRWEED
jgi:hypothetical protein